MLRAAVTLALLSSLPLWPAAAPATPPNSAAQATPATPAPAAAPAGPPASAPAATPATGEGGLTGREKELLEKIRQLKAPRLRSFGNCRYDWGAWRLNEKAVRSTASECGEPPTRGTVAVYCDTLQINRRVEEGPWEGWRLPYNASESPLLGDEERMVAALCANVKPSAPSTRPAAPPPLGGPAAPAAPAAKTPKK
ncbi:MAG: hypothetical protein ACKO6F_03435 [Cyanobium sp.]